MPSLLRQPVSGQPSDTPWLDNPLPPQEQKPPQPSLLQQLGSYLVNDSIPAKAVKSAWSGVTAPGDAWAGKIAPEDMNQRAWDMAGLVTGGSAFAPAEEGNVLRMGAGGPTRDALAQIKAYHGSPHDFDAFDLSKIGTGEGAQAYGHGLYFADNEAVAKGYRDALSPASPTFEGNPLDTRQSYWGTHDALEQADWRQAKVFDDFAKAPGNTTEERMKYVRDWYRDQPQMMAAIDQLEPKFGTKSQGHMYEVNINADPNHMLDWDKSLRDQPQILKQITDQYGGEDAVLAKSKAFEDLSGRMHPPGGANAQPSPEDYHAMETEWNAMRRDPAVKIGEMLTEMRKPVNPYGYDPGSKQTGEKLYRALGSNQGANEPLSQAGIPGIKYLDAGSRSAGEGSRNYVVFDDKLIDIVKKYGIAGAVAMGALTAEQAKQFQNQQQGNQDWLQKGGT